MQSLAPEDTAVLAGSCNVKVAAPVGGSVMQIRIPAAYVNVPALVGAHWQLTQSVRGASVDCEPDALSNRRAAVEPRDAKRVQEAELRVRQSTTREAGLVSAFLPSQQA